MRKRIKNSAGQAIKGIRQIEYISGLVSSRQKRRIEERQARRNKNGR